MSDFLRASLESNLPQASKKKKISLGIWEKNLAGSIKAQFPHVQCETTETNAVVADLLRGLRQHGDKLVSFKCLAFTRHNCINSRLGQTTPARRS